MLTDYFIVFFISFSCILLELFFTRILNFKTWNHVVYIIIPFAILGYGVGANIFLVLKNKLERFTKTYIIGLAFLFFSATSVLSTLFLIYLPIRVASVTGFFDDALSILKLLLAYTVLMVPFVIIGFIVVYLFSYNSRKSNKLYFWDLLGAGGGAIAFFYLINSFEVCRSIIFLSIISLAASILMLSTSTKKRWLLAIVVFLFSFVCLLIMPEPKNYNIDKSKGWEWIPGHFKKEHYEVLFSKWHPFGRTDIYRITDPQIRQDIYDSSVGTFEINITPLPEFAYICTNFLAGTPIYKLSTEGMQDHNSQVKTFSQAMELPYTILNEPNVVVIGTGGGRDIFMARTHGARDIIGAEINPAVYDALSVGGNLYSYSGGVYGMEGVNVLKIDGRHLVKTLSRESYDLIVLNGVDTFSGLSTGAYTYAEGYLYTKNAILDYLQILNKNGMISFNRWFFPDKPRETLRLFAIALDALRSYGTDDPSEHVIVGGPHEGWSLVLIKNTPFSTDEKKIIFEYLEDHNVPIVFPGGFFRDPQQQGENYFTSYAQSFMNKKEKQFVKKYPYDISVISDNNPFFYKYYKFKSFNPFDVLRVHHTGTVVFMTQFLVLVQAVVFIMIFIFTPLLVFKKNSIRTIPYKARKSFITFFSCLGLGFMFIEISLMQRFVLLLGSPIYSISVTLAALLIFAGIGSFSLTYLQKIHKKKSVLVALFLLILLITLSLFVIFGTDIINHSMHLSFVSRILVVCLMLLPLGLSLGTFFPSGLQLIGTNYQEAIAWAWGINCGFTVLGSILAITIAQFYGFNFILVLAALIYVLAMLSFVSMERVLR